MTTSTPNSRSRRPLLAAAVGNTVEWYDLTVYSTFAVYFSPLFFASESATAALLSTFAIFAVGFFFRPLGGWLLGAYADRKGRKAALTLTIALMAIPTFAIGLAPTYEAIGIAAPVLLVLARITQGFAAGGESGGAMAYLSEIAPEKRRGMFTSMWYSTVVAGMTVATILGFVLVRVLGEPAMQDWGWRIPFIIGGFAGLVGLWIRRTIEETDAFQEHAASEESHGRTSIVTLLREYPREVLVVMGITAGAATAFYTFVSYMPTHLISTVGLPADQTFAVHTVALLAFMIMLPLLGRLSDEVGRRKVGMVFGIFGAITVVPLSAALGPTWQVVLLIDLTLLAILACIFSVIAAIMTESFPTRMRAMGVGVPYNVATAAFGGTAPFLLTWLSGMDKGWLFFAYLGVLMALVAVALMFSRPPVESPSAEEREFIGA